MSVDGKSGQRRVWAKNLVLREADCPGFLAFLDSLPAGTHTAFLRGVLNSWYLHHRAVGDLETAAQRVIVSGVANALRLPNGVPGFEAAPAPVPPQPVPAVVRQSFPADHSAWKLMVSPRADYGAPSQEAAEVLDTSDASTDDLLFCLEHEGLFDPS